MLREDKDKTLVQCKNWRSRSVGVPIIRELYGLVVAEKASHEIVVCSGNYSKDAIDFARGKSLTLIGGKELVQLIGSVQKAQKIKSTKISKEDPECPTCGKLMVLRTAKRGKTVEINSGVVRHILNAAESEM